MDATDVLLEAVSTVIEKADYKQARALATAFTTPAEGLSKATVALAAAYILRLASGVLPEIGGAVICHLAFERMAVVNLN